MRAPAATCVDPVAHAKAKAAAGVADAQQQNARRMQRVAQRVPTPLLFRMRDVVEDIEHHDRVGAWRISTSSHVAGDE